MLPQWQVKYIDSSSSFVHSEGQIRFGYLPPLWSDIILVFMIGYKSLCNRADLVNKKDIIPDSILLL